MPGAGEGLHRERPGRMADPAQLTQFAWRCGAGRLHCRLCPHASSFRKDSRSRILLDSCLTPMTLKMVLSQSQILLSLRCCTDRRDVEDGDKDCCAFAAMYMARYGDLEVHFLVLLSILPITPISSNHLLINTSSSLSFYLSIWCLPLCSPLLPPPTDLSSKQYLRNLPCCSSTPHSTILSRGF